MSPRVMLSIAPVGPLPPGESRAVDLTWDGPGRFFPLRLVVRVHGPKTHRPLPKEPADARERLLAGRIAGEAIENLGAHYNIDVALWFDGAPVVEGPAIGFLIDSHAQLTGPPLPAGRSGRFEVKNRLAIPVTVFAMVWGTPMEDL